MACTALLAVAALFIPVPYQVRCESLTQAVQRQVVSAPFDCVLGEVLVNPGQEVSQGDVLAKLTIEPADEERARLLADLEQAVQNRESARAHLRTAEQQLAQLESERIAARLRLLDYRQQTTEIRSPIAGIVDINHVASQSGQKMAMGTPLVEVIPQDRILVEAAVPESLISFVAAGQSVVVNFGPHGTKRQAKIEKLAPRSELRDGANVFVAKLVVDNSQGNLKPGMTGQVLIQTGNRTLGWIVFHRWTEVISKAFAW
jgi:multidrug resistance efflux pump